MSSSFTRRQFMHLATALTLMPLLGSRGWAWASQEPTAEQASAGGPKDPSWKTVIVSPEEPGEPLVVSGVIYAADGKTPAAGALLYVYHTDARGYYRYTSTSNANPRLRGWMKTGADGRYEFRTIRPGSYPNSRNPQHIHGTLAATGYPARWIDEFHFLDDPLLPERDKASIARDGDFSSVLRPMRDKDGVWRATRHFRLK